MADDVSASKARRKRLPKWLAVAALIVGLIVVDIAGLHLSLFLRVRSELAAIRKAGYPVTIRELQAYYPYPSAEDNGANLLRAAFTKLTVFSDDVPLMTGHTKLPARGEPLPDSMKKVIGGCLSDNADALRLLREGESKKQCRFPRDFSINDDAQLQLEYLRQFRSAARLLELQAVLNAEENRPEEAADSIAVGLNLAKALNSEPLAISYYLRLSLDEIAVASIERVLSRIPLGDDHLARLAAAFESEEDPEALLRVLVGERCLGLRLFEHATVQELSYGTWVPKPWVVAYTLTGWRQSDYLTYLHVMRDCVAASKLPLPDRFRRADELRADLYRDVYRHPLTTRISPLQPNGIYVGLPIGSGSGAAFHLDADHVALVRAARAGLAVERYRLANRNLPESLQALVPAFIDSVPQDPFDGKPLRYRKLAKGYVVYSVDPDLQDNGRLYGELASPGAKPYDITFTVAR